MTGTFDTVLRRRAERVSCELAAQDEAWGQSGWTRRRFLAGVGMAGVATLGSQLVTSRASFASAATANDQTLVVVFMRGAADGLRILVPSSSDLGVDYLRTVRSKLVPTDAIALPGTSGWALNKNLKPLYDGLWGTGELAFVPAVSVPGVSHSHFQAAQFLEKGGSDTATTGWLDRALSQMGLGTTFRAISEGSATPASLAGPVPSVTLSGINTFTFPGTASYSAAAEKAMSTLYRGVGSPLADDVPDTLAALTTAATIQAKPATTTVYPSGAFASALKDIAGILKAEVGMQVATVDVGGWDTHTDEANDLDNNLAAAGTALRAFMDDLGPTRRKRVTVVVMTEFGRRVAMNDSGGTDHGHGSVMWLLGGGLAKSSVFGKWNKLSATTVDSGDVPGLNSPFDVLGELAQKRLGVGSPNSVFPGYALSSLGVATTS
ncbi:DUF1501 domain-containing protein [uncultured Jatrophihabitans sp.]|uniref:DUF1501 domain-containing protein n=1 Tax=uncultured Jatrophihabitans sp. TaxID=1610747 RepID=UPI0035C94D6E